ncbi:hypothetical protein PMAYCL1PPCAC_25672, partial [Pristionchus mayeri]
QSIIGPTPRRGRSSTENADRDPPAPMDEGKKDGVLSMMAMSDDEEQQQPKRGRGRAPKKSAGSIVHVEPKKEPMDEEEVTVVSPKKKR